jgi:vacuolar-type H+-ATPase subunit I/STV1
MNELQDKIRELAELRKTTEHKQELMETRFEAVKASPLYHEFAEEEAAVKELQEQMQALRSEINALTIAAYQQTGDKKPTFGVGIRVGKSYIYDQDVAKSYCLAELPEALRLDTRTFVKYVKGVQDVKPLNFVTVEEKITATIASDLSEYLED